MSFESLGLHPEIVKIVEKVYLSPYPIQEQAIPAIIAKQDVLGIAQTGSGKTASFALPILHDYQKKRLAPNRHVQTLILAPTRELVIQIADVLEDFNEQLSTPVKVMAVFGGVSINPQMKHLNRTNILVATPGRLLDLVKNGAVHLDRVDTLVIDEADKMLEMGFQDELREVLDLLPFRRQNLLFTATMDEDVKPIADRLLKKPVVIEIEPEVVAIDRITQRPMRVTAERKGLLLRYLIKTEDKHQVLVFVSSTRLADNLTAKLERNGIEAAAMHSQKSQGARMDVLKRFKSGELRVLVATDIASRGIDVKGLPCVINYDLPRSPLDYVHRIGRTGRADQFGEAISLITDEEEHHFYIIQKKMKQKIPYIFTDELDLSGY